MIDRLLKNVLDVPGVDGVCLFDRQGNFRPDWLPSYYLAPEFDQLLERCLSLYDTVDEHFVPCDDYLFKFPAKWLHLRRGRDTFLLIVSEASVNTSTLKMVTNLLLKYLTPEIIRDAPTTVAAPAPVSSPFLDAPREMKGATRGPFSSNRTAAPFKGAESAAEASRGRVTRPAKRTFRGSEY